MAGIALRRREAQIDHGLGGAFWILGTWRLLEVVASEGVLWPRELRDRAALFFGLALLLVGCAALRRARQVWREESAEDEARLHAFLRQAAQDLRQQLAGHEALRAEELEAWIRRRFEPCRERANCASHESPRLAAARRRALARAEESLRAARAALLDGDDARARRALEPAASQLQRAAEPE
ncbi:MAG: hypothetical protein IPN34_09895 [Planctomycetes bacterium]|nr:hypothetical protein [Planctomycetota bacterium]